MLVWIISNTTMNKEELLSKLVETNKELAFQNNQTEKRAQELIIANKELAFQNKEKEKRAQELIIANKELAFQNKEKEKRASELIIANKELAFQNKEKGSRAAELIIANKELIFQNKEKENRAAELIIANKELAFQNKEKESRAAELIIANKELVFQNKEKGKRAEELIITDKKILFQNEEKKKRAAELTTERRKADKNLRKSEASLKEAQAIAQVGNWEIDLTHNVHYWSDEIYKIFGVNKKDIVPSQESFLASCHPEDLGQTYKKIGKGFKTLTNISFDFRFIRQDGVIRHAYNEWKFKFDKHGNPEWLLGIFQDITDRKLAETERTKIVNDLISRNKDLEQFAYIVSHNLRAPVANILGATAVLNDPELNLEDKEILSKGIYDCVTVLDAVIKDLDDILQVKGKINKPKEKVHFSELVNEIKISIKNLIDKDQIEIKCDFSEIDKISIFKSYLYSIFFNLISNSIKYRQQEIPCIIEIKSHLTKDKIKLIFKDNGMGIDLTKRGNQIFGLYKRFHTHIDGKGMGLFMVKTQVEALGGKIHIGSKVNKGTEFKIEFER